MRRLRIVLATLLITASSNSSGRKNNRNFPQALERVLENGILMVSDIQIFASIAVIICGLAQLLCSISAYHWQIVVYTAWFSSLTHLTPLTAIRYYFSHINLKARTARFMLMACTLILLTVALVPTGNINWFVPLYLDRDNYGVPAICYFAHMSESSNYVLSEPSTSSILVSTVILWISFAARIVKLYPSLSRVATGCLRDEPGKLLKKQIKRPLGLRGHAQVLLKMTHGALTAQLILFRAVFDFYDSLLWEISKPILYKVQNVYCGSHL